MGHGRIAGLLGLDAGDPIDFGAQTSEEATVGGNEVRPLIDLRFESLLLLLEYPDLLPVFQHDRKDLGQLLHELQWGEDDMAGSVAPCLLDPTWRRNAAGHRSRTDV